MFEELLQAYPYLINVSAMDADLFIWAAAQPQNRGQRITGPQSERARLVLERGETDVSERVPLAAGPGQPARLVFIRHPVHDQSGQIVGLLQLALPLETLHAALHLDTAEPDRPVAIVHADGTLLASSRGGEPWSAGDGSGALGSLDLQATGGVLDVRDTAGGQWLVAYQRAGSLPWYALVATRRFEAFAPLRQLALSTAVTVLVVTLAAGLIGSWLARGITRPIGTLVNAAGRFAERDFSHRVRLGEAASWPGSRRPSIRWLLSFRPPTRISRRGWRNGRPSTPPTASFETVNAGLQETVECQVRELERTNQLKRYLSPRVADLLVSERAEVGARIRRRDLSVLFTDVRGFTSISEEIEPEDLVELLNAFLTEMTQAVFDEGGTLDKYLGDGLMAFFGDPIPYDDHADRAVRAALSMHERLARVQQRWFALGQRPLSIGVGIASGFVTVGAIGSPERLEYTVIGNNVNLAARLVSAAGPGEILCNARTAAAVERWALVHERGPETIRGRARPVNVFEIAGFHDADSAPVEQLTGRA